VIDLRLLLYNSGRVKRILTLVSGFVALMAQFSALIWLKWTLFRNAMRSRKAVLSKIASILGTLAALAVALVIAVFLGIVVYRLLAPGSSEQILEQLQSNPQAAEMRAMLRPGFLLFLIFAILYLMWATVPLSLGGGSQFNPGRLLLYPVSLRKLFAIDFFSELTSIGSIFAIPTILAVALGAGLGLRSLLPAFIASLFIIGCGISIAKWLSTSMSSLSSEN
jgi:hypothetical protein